MGHQTLEEHSTRISEFISSDYPGMYRPPGGSLKHPFLAPGSAQYADVLWDWDSWLSNIALRQALLDFGDADAVAGAEAFERGCILNFLEIAKNRPQPDGWIPILINRDGHPPVSDIYATNMHKPCLAQHAAFLVREADGDAEWLREHSFALQAFVDNYQNHHKHECGLFYWHDDVAIGVDNDPCTFGRPPRSSGSIFLNCLMFRELRALAYILRQLNLDELSEKYESDAIALKTAVQTHCWDERDGFFYSVDLNLNPIERHEWRPHAGMPRGWPCLIQRIGVWSGFLALWAEIATMEQAKRISEEHYRNEKTFGAPAGVRTLSRMEKMYDVRASGNPSSWLGPVWGVSNYLTFRGFVKYGLEEDAMDLAEKTIRLFGRDFQRFGALHEYYQPENGEPILNRGFQNWNYLVLNMIAWREKKQAIAEFQLKDMYKNQSSIPSPLPRISRFETLGFGLFVHWGLYSQLGKGEWVQHNNHIPVREYARLQATFTAADFDARSLAKLARQSGMRYITITTRHHEGFSLYDTRGLSKFDAPHSPARRDLIAEFVEACRMEKIIPFFYHTTLDWRWDSAKCSCKKFNDYLDYLNESVEVLCRHYGEIGGLWFDGNWSRPAADWKEDRLYSTIRKYQPQAIIVNNTGLEARGATGHHEIDSTTFEQGLPSLPDRRGGKKYLAAEMCETLNGHWGEGHRDFNFKSPAEIITHLCACRKVGANYLLNVGPTATGAIPEYEAALLRKVGAWIALHGELIYGGKPTSARCQGQDFILKRGGKYFYFAHGLSREGDTHVVVQIEGNGPRVVENLPSKIHSCRWLDNGRAIRFTQSPDHSLLTLDCTGYDYGSDLVVRVAEMA